MQLAGPLRNLLCVCFLVVAATPVGSEIGVTWRRVDTKGAFEGPETRYPDPADSLYCINDRLYLSTNRSGGPWRLDPGGIWHQGGFFNQFSGIVGSGTLGSGRRLIVGSFGQKAYHSLDGGVTWSASPSPGLQRHGMSGFVHQGSFYLAGGYEIVTPQSTHVPRRSIHSSSDGGTWQQVGQLPFDVNTAGYVFSNGDLIVALENATGIGTMRAWTSVDGVAWDAVDSSTMPTVRDGARVFRMGDTFWLTGGWEWRALGPLAQPYPRRLGDCWKSTDGLHWEMDPAVSALAFPSHYPIVVCAGRAYTNGTSSAPVPERDNATRVVDALWSSADLISWHLEYRANSGPPIRTMVKHNGVLWGFPASIGETTSDIYTSQDGVLWRPVQTNIPPRHDQSATSHAGKLWVVGGYTNTGFTELNDVWSSTDGVHWTQVTSTAAFPPRSNGGLVSFNGALHLIGGTSYEMPYGDYVLGDVWRSADGVDWTRLRSTAIPGRIPGPLAVFNGRLHVFGGNHYGVPLGDSYATSDGVVWDYLGQTYGLEGRHSQGVYVIDDALYLAGGSGAEGAGVHGFEDIRRSTDAVNWTIKTEHADFGTKSYVFVQPMQDTLLMIASNYGLQGEVWVSGEGAYPFADPQLVDFGEVPMGLPSPATRAVTVQNYLPLAFDPLGLFSPVITGIDEGEFGISASEAPTSLGPGAEAEVTVSYSPTRQGRAEAMLTIPTDDPQHPVVNIVLTGRGGISSAAGAGWEMFE